MKSFYWLDRYQKVDKEYRDIDTMEGLFDYTEREDIEKKEREVKRELKESGRFLTL